jgi:hypothetical protein
MAKKPAPIAHEFVLDELANLRPITKPMFGSHGVYVDGKIVFILRERESHPSDNGVWLATTPEHHDSLRTEFSILRSITVFGPGVTGWQVLPSDSDDFEHAVLRACKLVQSGDPRIGKVTGAKAKKSSSKKASAKKAVPKKSKAKAKVAAKKKSAPKKRR